jgi:uncharacterized protein DUF3485
MVKRSATGIVIASLSALLVYTRLPTNSGITIPPERLSINLNLEGTGFDCHVTSSETKTESANRRYETVWSGTCEDSQGSLSRILIGYTSEQRGEQKRLVALADYLEGASVWKQTTRHTTIPIYGNTNDYPLFRAGSTHLQTRSGETISVLYWYQMDGHGYGDEFRYRAALLWKKILKRPTTAALIMVSTPLRDRTEADVLASQIDVAKLVHQRIVTQIPSL